MQGAGCRVQAQGQVQGAGAGVRGAGCRVQGALKTSVSCPCRVRVESVSSPVESVLE